MKTAEAVKQLKEKLGNVLVQETEFHGEIDCGNPQRDICSRFSLFSKMIREPDMKS